MTNTVHMPSNLDRVAKDSQQLGPADWYVVSYRKTHVQFVVQNGSLNEKGDGLEDVTETIITQMKGIQIMGEPIHPFRRFQAYKLPGRVDAVPTGAKPTFEDGNLLARLKEGENSSENGACERIQDFLC